MPKFQVGDKVRVMAGPWYTGGFAKWCMGKEGIVRVLQAGSVGVQFSGWTGGHNLNGSCPHGEGQYIAYHHLESAIPLSPFDQEVRDYITRELPPNG